MKAVLVTLCVFFVTALCEIGGGYSIWLLRRKQRRVTFALLGALLLVLYGALQTVQPANFGRVYAAYGGIFIVASFAWGILIDEEKLDLHELVGCIISLIGAAIIFYSPR